jgi:tRNA1(Val) A37 N6-methylase TrmN6
LGGRLHLLQPAKGFRAGLDSVLLGAAVGAKTGVLLDLGAGVGTAALVALAHRPGLSAVLAENDPEALGLARDNIASNGLTGRATTVDVDVTAAGAARAAAGLEADRYAAVIANPPYFAEGQGTLAKGAGRSGARHMGAEALALWGRTAAGAAAPRGEVIFIMPAEALAALLAALSGRLGALAVLPLLPRPGEPASRILVRGIKGSRAPSTLLASRPLHGPQGNAFLPEFEAILRGEASLDW